MVVVSVQSLSDKDITRFDDGNENGATRVNNVHTISDLTPTSE
jgi:hypothetical protein